jgi:hypothetical protein
MIAQQGLAPFEMRKVAMFRTSEAHKEAATLGVIWMMAYA